MSLFTFLFTFVSFINIIQAEEISAACEYGGEKNNCRWRYNPETKQMVVSGIKGMPFYANSEEDDNIGRPYWKYKDEIETVIIEDGITEISTSSFEAFSNLNNETWKRCENFQSKIISFLSQIREYHC